MRIDSWKHERHNCKIKHMDENRAEQNPEISLLGLFHLEDSKIINSAGPEEITLI